MTTISGGCVRAALAILALAAVASRAAAQSTSRVSVSSAGVSADGYCAEASISSDGRFVAFVSGATNLVPDDVNLARDVFVHDRLTGETTRVSVSSTGVPANGDCFNAIISADGRVVTFASAATNLVPGDTNAYFEIYVHDRATAETSRVSVSSAGIPGNARCFSPSLSGDGGIVVFDSEATDLVPGDLNGFKDVFVHDRLTGETSLVSVDSGGAPANGVSDASVISADGRFVAFESRATNLVSGDGNGITDIFVHDRATGATSRVSVDSSGAEGDSHSHEPAITFDGRFVAFESAASTLVPGDANQKIDVFVHDRATGETTIASVDSASAPGNDASSYARLSDDGRFVTFASDSSNLVPLDTNARRDVFVRDRLAGETSRVSVDSAGVQADGSSFASRLSPDGRLVVFESAARNLAPGDANGTGLDVFIRDRFDCREGNVNGGAGLVADVLFVNDSVGDSGRTVRLLTYEPLTVFVAKPPAESVRPAVFALYAWGVVPAPGARPIVLPFGTGETCLPTPITGGSPAPLVVWNNTGSPRGGSPTRPSSPAPSLVLSRALAFRRPVSCFLQGVIRDAGAPNGFAAATNGVTIEIR